METTKVTTIEKYFLKKNDNDISKGPLTYDNQIQLPKFSYDEYPSDEETSSISDFYSQDSDTPVHIGDIQCKGRNSS